ncbi:MAG: carbohydrate ABC transporter permease [Caldilineaceae bacterium]
MSTIAQSTPTITKRHSQRKWALTAFGIFLTALMLFPFYMIINYSLMDQIAILTYPPPLIPPVLTFDGYTSAFAVVGDYLRNSLIYGIGTMLVAMVIATPAAYGLSRIRSQLSLYLLLGLLLAQMAPGIVVANSLYALFTKVHLLNTHWAVILADCTAAVPFAIIVMRAFMLSIPQELVEAAMVDGANHWTIFVAIILPISRTAIITASLFAFLSGWGDFMMALILNPNTTPITVGIYYFIGSYSTNWPSVMAVAAIAAVPAIILLSTAQRYITAGLTTGAVKE